MVNVVELLDLARREDVALIRFEYCDFSGVARTKAVNVSQLRSKLSEGVALTRAQMSINLLEEVIDVEGMAPIGEIRIVPDLDTFSILPWSPRSASILCDQLDHDRKDWGACPRSFLKGAIDKAAEMGLRIEAAFENEYYLAREVDGKFVALDVPNHAPVYSSIGHDFHDYLSIETIEALEAQGMIVEQSINEYGAGQREISIRYSDALRAADNQMKFRDTIRGVALKHDIYASFAPKPFPDQIGSGAHVHFSVWDEAKERNLFYSKDDPKSFSDLGRSFIAGVALHLPALVALTAPSYNSYRRLTPSAWASATNAWGYDNKEAALRVTSPFYGNEERSMNVEFKPSDPSANPYLSLGGLIYAGLDGIERGLTPNPPCVKDPARYAPEELDALGVVSLPSSMEEALNNLEADQYLMSMLGEMRSNAYLKVRRSEAKSFSKEDVDFEIANHFYKF